MTSFSLAVDYSSMSTTYLGGRWSFGKCTEHGVRSSFLTIHIRNYY